jgi:hypothetical protein
VQGSYILSKRFHDRIYVRSKNVLISLEEHLDDHYDEDEDRRNDRGISRNIGRPYSEY